VAFATFYFCLSRSKCASGVGAGVARRRVGKDKLVRWSNIDKVLLKVHLFAEHNNKRHNVLQLGEEWDRLLIRQKIRELFVEGWHCTRNEVHIHKTHLRKSGANTVNRSDIPVLSDGFRDFLKSLQKDSIHRMSRGECARIRENVP
jgi:hypothetical protein